jgi:RND family efflux transporter MFP subunit
MYKKNVLIILSATFMIGCSSKQEKNVAESLSVKTVTVNETAETGQNTYIGTVEESYGSQISFATMGTVSAVNADEGMAVKKGQVLATLDKSTMMNTYEIANSTLSQTMDAYKRMRTLYNKGSLPEIKFIEIQTKLDQARANERIAKKNLGDCILRAPFNGYISQRSIDVGNNVTSGISCFKIVKIDNVKVKVSVPEKEISQIHIGMPVSFSVAALDDHQFTGIIKEKGVQANALSHTYDIKIEVNNKNHILLPGMVCSAEINISNRDKTIIIPQETVLVDGEGEYVWVVNGNETHRRSITTAGVNSKGAIIASGLHNGEQIVTSGFNKISEDSKVKIQ